MSSHVHSYAEPDTLLAAALAPMDWTRSVSLVFVFSLLTALAAQIVIPVGPVPITAQTFAVLLTGALLGSRLGAMAMIVYLVEGASGLPFFYGGHGGLTHLARPNGWLPGCVSRRRIYHRRVCGKRLGQTISDGSRGDGRRFGNHYHCWLGVVFICHTHCSRRSFQAQYRSFSRRRCHQDSACRCSASYRLAFA